MTDVWQKKTMCQDMSDEAGSEDEGEAEHDEMLLEYAGEVRRDLWFAVGSRQ